jgi:hypothetical protein
MENRRDPLVAIPLAGLAQNGGGSSSLSAQDIYKITPADLIAANEQLQRCEQEWRAAGAAWVSESRVEQLLQHADVRECEVKRARDGSRPSARLKQLKLVHLFAQSGIPRFGRGPIIGYSSATICGVALLLSPFVFSTITSAFCGSLISTVLGSGLLAIAVFRLWPTESKLQSFQLLRRQCKDANDELDLLQPLLTQARTDYESARRQLSSCRRLAKARQRRDELIAVLASARYQLIHSNWRAMRGVEFENFLKRVFEALGYQVRTTKGSGDQQGKRI